MKKALALILVLVMILSLVACGGGNSKQSTNPPSNNEASSNNNNKASDDGEVVAGKYVKDNINVAISADGGTFDPFANFVNWGSASMTSLIYQGLIQTDYDYNVYYEIAKEITQIDELHWQVVIWDCVYDTANAHITIDDVIWGYEQVIATGNKGAISKFVKLEKVDDYTAIMELSQPFGDGDFEKHFGNVKVLSKATYEAQGNDMTTTPIGTGPYVLDSYTVGSEVVLRANENYWGNNVEQNNPFAAQNFETITYKIIQDASSRAIALEMGTVDVCDAMDAMDISNIDTSKYNLITQPQRPPVAFVMNASADSELSSLELRQAILYGLDNDAIAAALAVPATAVYGIQPGMVDAPESWTTGEGHEYYNYDPEKAAELIAASGYNGETITLMYVSSTANDGAAIMMQSQMKELGVNIELMTLDQTTAMEYQYDSTKWDIRLATMGGGAYLSQTLKSWWSEDSAQHFSNGENIAMVPDAELDTLYVALKDDVNDETITAWVDYFDSMAYGYAICSFANQTACAGDLQSVYLTPQGAVVPNTFILAE